MFFPKPEASSRTTDLGKSSDFTFSTQTGSLLAHYRLGEIFRFYIFYPTGSLLTHYRLGGIFRFYIFYPNRKPPHASDWGISSGFMFSTQPEASSRTTDWGVSSRLTCFTQFHTQKGSPMFEQNPKLRNIHPTKLKIINEIKEQSRYQSAEELLPQILQINQELKRRNLSFTKEESALLLEAMEESMSPAERQKFQMIKSFFL